MSRSVIRRVGLLLMVDIFILLSGMAQAQESGEATFNRICKACHTIGQGKLVGPDLAGVSQRHSPDWIVSFVQSSTAMIKAGDPAAVAVFEANNKLLMPDNPVSRAEVLEIIKYIEATAGDPSSAGEAPPTPLDTATAEDFKHGAALFQGSIRLANGGPACSGCHHVHAAGVMGGGALAKDLTGVIGRMPAPGVQAILSSPPFPAMSAAYLGKPLTTEENFALTAFLQKLHADQTPEIPSDMGRWVFSIGTVGAALLMALYSMIWMNRKKKRIYGDIHDRQTKTT